MKTFLTSFAFLLFLCIPQQVSAQSEQPYRGMYHSAEHGVSIVINLYEDDVIVPGYGFLGPVGGYMMGDSAERLYGTWILISSEIKSDHAVLRFSNDTGSESQTVTLTLLPDGSLRYHAVGTNEVRRRQGRKLVKISSEMNLKFVGR